MEHLNRVVKWKLILPWGKPLRFHFQIVPANDDLEWDVNIPSSTTDLLGLLQDTFYVTHWLNILEENYNLITKEELDERDNYWYIFIWVWYRFIEIIQHNYHQITNNQSSMEYEVLQEMHSENYLHFIENMGEPYITRYKLYEVVSLLVPSNRFSHLSLANIICDFNSFVKFWNKSLKLLPALLTKIQHYKVERLRKQFNKIIDANSLNNEYKRFKNKYLQEGKDKCFSMTTVTKKDGTKKDLLCFCGVPEFDPNSKISKAIDLIVNEIKNNRKYYDPERVTAKDSIRYYIDHKTYITYVQATHFSCFSNNPIFNRMFSCCERKTFAHYDEWSECVSYTMVVKYPPCELCNFPVIQHCNKYNGHIIPGKKNEPTPLENLDIYNMLAKCIHTGGCRYKP